MKPVRLQLSRKKGFNLQELSRRVNGFEAVNVARPTKWGNPYTVTGAREAGYRGTDAQLLAMCIREYRANAIGCLPIDDLRGKNLACWCKPGDPCHADVLLEMANRDEAS